MIWIKTEAGRLEMQTKALLKDRGQRTLLLLIDGQKTEEVLLGHLAGVQRTDFDALQALGLIAPLVAKPAPSSAERSSRSSETSRWPLDYAQFTSMLTEIIARELGLRGFVLTLAVEKAGTADELKSVAQRVLDQVRSRKGEAAAEAARHELFGPP